MDTCFKRLHYVFLIFFVRDLILDPKMKKREMIT